MDAQSLNTLPYPVRHDEDYLTTANAECCALQIVPLNAYFNSEVDFFSVLRLHFPDISLLFLIGYMDGYVGLSYQNLDGIATGKPLN